MAGMAPELVGMTGWFGRWRRARAVRRQAIDARQWQQVVSRFSFLRMLPAADQRRLHELVAVFLDRKAISGAGGQDMTREMQLVIAAQACLLVLNLDLDFYDDWVEIIVYPDEFVIDHEYMDEDGVMHHVRAPASGEAWEQGPVILSWRDAEEADGGDGYNVVLHEFAHKIDIRNGTADGFPPLLEILESRAERIGPRLAVHVGMQRLERREETALDEYAAEDPAEFFAVLSELFFERPDALAKMYPAVYGQFTQFYRQDPLLRMRPASNRA